MKFCTVVIDCSACILWALFLLVFPLKWMIAFFLAALIHEVFHYIAINLLGKRVKKIQIGFGGIKIDIPNMTYGEECLCALAGPVGGFLLLSMCRIYPELAVWGMFQSIYNLLPVYPLDGGRAVRCIALILFPRYADIVCLCIEMVTIIGIILVCIVLRMGFLSVLIGCFLTGKILYGKRPCKQSILGVQ